MNQGKRRHLNQQEKIRALALRDGGTPIKKICDEFGVSRTSIQRLFRLSKAMKEEHPKQFRKDLAPKRKEGSGGRVKFTLAVLKKMQKVIRMYPFYSARQIKRSSPLFADVSLSRIRHHLCKTLLLPARRPAKKPLLTEAMKLKRLNFARKHLNWSQEKWGTVMYSDESSFQTIRCVGPRSVRRPMASATASSSLSRLSNIPSTMVWGCFSAKGRGGLFFVPQKETMNSVQYIACIKDHLFPFMVRHRCKFFLQDGARPHVSKATMAVINQKKEELGFEVIDWPGNSPDLNPIENCWNWMKDKLQPLNVTSIQQLWEEIKRLWCTGTPTKYLKKLSDSMPRRLQMVVDSNGEMTKY